MAVGLLKKYPPQFLLILMKGKIMKRFLIWALTSFYPVIVMEKTEKSSMFEDEKGNTWQAFCRKRKAN